MQVSDPRQTIESAEEQAGRTAPAAASRRLRAGFRLDPILAALLVVSVALNVVLAIGVAVLIEQRVEPSQAVLIGAGALVRPIAVRTPSGADSLLLFGDERRPTLLYLLDTNCVWCERNLVALRVLAPLASRSYRMVALSTQVLPPEWVARMPSGFEYFVLKDPADAKLALGARGTPYTLVISPAGRVLYAWAGAYRGRGAREIEHVLGIKIPPV